MFTVSKIYNAGCDYYCVSFWSRIARLYHKCSGWMILYGFNICRKGIRVNPKNCFAFDSQTLTLIILYEIFLIRYKEI